MIFILIAVFLIGKWFVTSFLNKAFSVKDDGYLSSGKEEKTIINNYYNENHLHVSEEEYNRLKGLDK